MRSQGTMGAGSSAGRKDPPLEYEMNLGEFFKIACKENEKKTGNSLVEKGRLPTGNIATEFTELGSGIISSWLTCCVGHLAAGRSFKGSIDPNDFALVDGAIHALKVPKPGTSEERQADGKALATQFKKVFEYKGKLPSYMDHLLALLRAIPFGALIHDFQHRLLVHIAQMTSDGRLSLLGLLKTFRDNLLWPADFDRAVNAEIPSDWHQKLGLITIFRKVAFYRRPVADFLNLSVPVPIINDPKSAFDYLWNYGTHIGQHLKELNIPYDDGYELIIPDTFENFLACVMDNLLTTESLQAGIAALARSCLPSPIQVRVLQQQLFSGPHNASQGSSSSAEMLDPSKAIAPSVEESREARTPTLIDTLQQQLIKEQHKLEEQIATVKKLKDNLVEAERMTSNKIGVNIIVLGPISSGKSTATGHLLYKLGSIQQSGMDIIESEAKEMGKQSSRYAWVLDRLQVERTKGATIEINLGKFETHKYSCTIIDSPGNHEYIANMIAGTCHADCAVLMIDSTGSSETLREYVLIAMYLGVKEIICCCNKIDATSPPYSRDRYWAIVDEVSPYLKKVGYKLEVIKFIPLSGYHGDNLVERSKNLSWYEGDTLFEAFDKILVPERTQGKPLRLPLRGSSNLVEGATDIVAIGGYVAAGTLRSGMRVQVAPIGVTVKVISMEMASDKKHLDVARPGDTVTLFIRAKQEDLRCGYVLCELKREPALEALSFNAKVIVTSHLDVSSGFIAMLHCHTASVRVKFHRLLKRIDKKTGSTVEEEPKLLKKGELGIVKMIPCEPITLEASSVCTRLGRFVVCEKNRVIAAGVILNVETK